MRFAFTLALALPFFLVSNALANPLEKARKRLAETTMTDASLVAYDSCEQGVQETCLQAAIMFCLDKQEDIARDTLERAGTDFDASMYKPEIRQLTDALAKDGLVCGATTEKIALLTGDLAIVAGLILKRVEKEKKFGDDDLDLMSRICNQDELQSIGSRILLALSTEELEKTKDEGLACKAPGIIKIVALGSGSRVTVSGPMTKVSKAGSLRLIPGKYTVSVEVRRVKFPPQDIGVLPYRTTKVTLPAAVKVVSPTRLKDLMIGSESIKNPHFGGFNFVPAGTFDVAATTIIHKEWKRSVQAASGRVKTVTIAENDLVLRDDVAKYNDRERQRMISWGFIGAGAVAGAAAFVFNSNASASNDDAAASFEEYKSARTLEEANRLEGETATLDDEAASANTIAVLTGLVGTGVLSYGIYRLIDNVGLAKPPGVANTGPTLTPVASDSSAGLLLSQSW